MNVTLAIVLGISGAIFLLIAAIGGGFTVSVVSVPPVGVIPRVLSVIMGSALVFSALVAYTVDTSEVTSSQQAQSQTANSIPQPAPDPPLDPVRSGRAPESITAPIVAPDGYTVYLFSDVYSDSPSLADLTDGQEVEILCTMQGESVSSAINGHTSSLWDGVSVGGGDTVGFVPDVYVGTPTYQPTMPNCQELGHGDTART
jgi:hypothetical protein